MANVVNRIVCTVALIVGIARTWKERSGERRIRSRERQHKQDRVVEGKEERMAEAESRAEYRMKRRTRR